MNGMYVVLLWLVVVFSFVFFFIRVYFIYRIYLIVVKLKVYMINMVIRYCGLLF